jgi:hypothetical protein
MPIKIGINQSNSLKRKDNKIQVGLKIKMLSKDSLLFDSGRVVFSFYTSGMGENLIQS